MGLARRTDGSRWRSRIRHLIPSIVFVLGIALLMELLTRRGVVNPITLPPPSRVVDTLVDEVSEGDLMIDLFLTIERALIGLILAIVTSVPLGALVGRFRRIGQYVNPVVELLRPIPTPVYLPLAAVLAGYGAVPKVAVIFIGASFPVLLMTMQGVEAIDPSLERSARSLGYSRPAMVFKVLAPAAAPSIAAGIRTSLSLSPPYLNSRGHGYFLQRTWTLSRGGTTENPVSESCCWVAGSGDRGVFLERPRGAASTTHHAMAFWEDWSGLNRGPVARGPLRRMQDVDRDCA